MRGPEASRLLKNSTLRSIWAGVSELAVPLLIRAFPILIALALFPIYTLAESGAATYREHCAACHAANGAGDTMLGKNLKLRPLASPEVQNLSDDELASIISKGKNRMPAYGRKLSPQQISDLVKHIRSLKK